MKRIAKLFSALGLALFALIAQAVTVTAGTTGTYTFAAGESAAISLDANERALVSVLSSTGAQRYSDSLSESRTLGPFAVGDVLSITAQRGDIDYAIVSPTGIGIGTLAALSPAQVAAGAVTAAGVDTEGRVYGPVGVLSQQINLIAKGAKSGRVITDAVVTSSSNQFTSATIACTAADVGSLFTMTDPASIAGAFTVLNGTVTGCTGGNTITMSVTATFTNTGVGVAIGPDNAAAIAAATTALNVTSGSAVLKVPRGVYLTSAAFSIADGQSIVGDGPGADYGLVTQPIGAGSSFILASSLAGGSTFFTLGNSGNGTTSGTDRSVMQGIGIDAANNADYAVKTLTRRAQVQYNQIWRGRVETLRVLAQNSEYLKNVVGAQNVGNVMGIYSALGAADVKVLGGELRQGGSASFNASNGHQLYIQDPSDIIVMGVHMYAGSFTVVASTAQGADVMIRQTSAAASPIGGVQLIGNIYDGTYGPPIHVRNESGTRLGLISIVGGYAFTVPGLGTTGRWGVVEVAPVSGSIRGLSVTGLQAIDNISNHNFAGMVVQQNLDGTQTGLSGALTHSTVRDNTGIGVLKPYANFVPEARGGNISNPAGGTLATLDSNSGTATFSGTGAQTAFVIPHGLYGTPSTTTGVVIVTPCSAAANSAFYTTADATSITATYTAAPASGTNNVVLCWHAAN